MAKDKKQVNVYRTTMGGTEFKEVIIDEVSVFNRTLQPDEIAKVYRAFNESRDEFDTTRMKWRDAVEASVAIPPQTFPTTQEITKDCKAIESELKARLDKFDFLEELQKL